METRAFKRYFGRFAFIAGIAIVALCLFGVLTSCGTTKVTVSEGGNAEVQTSTTTTTTVTITRNSDESGKTQTINLKSKSN
ncbi:MAG: hypothetical protein LUC16_00955 [Coprobacillus sp.]|nr:hypothetical protein [Coprobacillus sp.]